MFELMTLYAWKIPITHGGVYSISGIIKHVASMTDGATDRQVGNLVS